ncbi:hypothetical protein NC652_030169 [Populus alba x Populus x berolinensis]|nr:hypothetical protein NC652_030165 [Populus alba x Populus x berolinensis]KAJ6889301.1 hypothetical protein NC652_030169 [Populus alba x Populus x berolinensis]
MDSIKRYPFQRLIGLIILLVSMPLLRRLGSRFPFLKGLMGLLFRGILLTLMI